MRGSGEDTGGMTSLLPPLTPSDIWQLPYRPLTGAGMRAVRELRFRLLATRSADGVRSAWLTPIYEADGNRVHSDTIRVQQGRKAPMPVGWAGRSFEVTGGDDEHAQIVVHGWTNTGPGSMEFRVKAGGDLLVTGTAWRYLAPGEEHLQAIERMHGAP